MNKTNDDHLGGELVTFNKKLTAISGRSFTTVEVLENGSGQWNSSTIQPTPSKFEKYSALVVTNDGDETLFMLGKYNFISK